MKASSSGFVTAVTLLAAPCLTADQLWWDGATGGAWGTPANWADAATTGADPALVPVSGDVANFNITGLNTAMIVNLGGPQAVSGINVTSTGGVTLQGGGAATTLTIGTTGITVTGSGTSANSFTIGSTTVGEEVAVVLGGSQTWSYSGGTGGSGITVRNGVSIADSGAAYTLTLGGGTTTTNPASSIAGVISDGSGTLSLTMNGTSNGRWNLGGANTYTGVTTISGGGLGISNINALGSTTATTGTSTVVNSGGSLFLRLGTTGTNTMPAETITVRGMGIADLGALRSVTGTNIWTGTIVADTTAGNAAIGSDGNFTLGSAADITGTGTNKLVFVANGSTSTSNMTVNGGISGAIGVTKGGTYANSTLLFGGDAKAYTGATEVNIGSMAINSTSLTGTSSVTVASGAKLVGNASTINLAAPVTVNGTLSPGTNFVSPIIGTMTMGALNLTPTSILQIDINSETAAKDLLNVTSLSLGGTLQVNDIGNGSLAIGQALLFIKNADVWNAADGVFTVGGVAINNESETFTRGQNTFQIKYDYVNGADQGVAFIVVVPEPAAAGLAAFGALVLGLRRRRAVI